MSIPFSLFLQFPELKLFLKRREICFSSATFKDCYQIVSFILPQLAEALHLPERFCYSRGQKEENHKDGHGKGISNVKEKLILHLRLMHDSSLAVCSTLFHRL